MGKSLEFFDSRYISILYRFLDISTYFPKF